MIVCAAVLLSANSATAIVGAPQPADSAMAQVISSVVSSRGTFCSGVLIERDVVLTAAHCVQPGTDYKFVQYDKARQPQLRDVKRLATHPNFSMQDILNHRASADIALLQLGQPLAVTPLPFNAPSLPLTAGRTFQIIGVGVTIRGEGKSGGTARMASLTATGKPGTLQIRLVDPATNNQRDGLGACTGDSGAPAFEEQDGRSVVIGIVSWSTAANNASGCGGLTGVTPLTVYKEWITRTLKAWRAHSTNGFHACATCGRGTSMAALCKAA